MRQSAVTDQFLRWESSKDVLQLVEELRQGKRAFEWRNWLDLGPVDMIGSRSLKKKEFPHIAGKRTGDLDFPPNEKMSSVENAMIGRLYSNYNMSNPSRVIVLGDPSDTATRGTYEVFDLEAKSEKKCHRQYGHSLCSALPQIKSSPIEQLGTAEPDKSFSSLDRMVVHIPSGAFVWDKDAKKSEAEKTIAESPDSEEALHANTLLRAFADVGDSKKYFHEVNLANDPLGYGVHYDWRFFRGVAGHEQHIKSIHNTIRAWAQFADAVGLAYWYAHGSLLGWWWNGLAMPWDADSDIQLPVAELNRLASIFNGSLIVTSAREGSKLFYLDVSPWYVERTKGNGKNMIDARFIDVSRGTYIDITGLAFSSSDEKVNCKNNHLYEIATLSPLRRTLFEGASVMVPRDVSKLLREEYEKFDVETFGSWVFNAKIQLWQITVSCKDFLKRFSRKSKVYCYPRSQIPASQCDFDLFGTCDQVAIDLYNVTETVTRVHQEEKELWQKLETDSESDAELSLHHLVKLLDEYYPPFR